MKTLSQSFTYNVVAENPSTGDFYVSESNIESKAQAYQLFDSLVNQHKYTAVRVDRTCVTVNALPNNKTESAIPISYPLKPSILIPIKPPINITMTKVLGTLHIALPPICALIIPTLTIAKKWSNPNTG